jgi:peptidyl-prolyl cis-trans isomerase SurA
LLSFFEKYMRMKKIIIVSSFFVSGLCMLAQPSSDKVLMTIAGEKITVQEFENVYRKNPSANQSDPKSLEEYVGLFVNFKLKVREARDLGMDTTVAFKSELSGYRKQLSQPYLTDTLITDKLLQEAYDRMKWHVKASHILIKVGQDALPKDTIAAWNKIMKIRDRIVKNKEDFGKLAEEFSEDPYAKGNEGDLGFFTALTGYVYPFESAAYNAKIGEVTMPVRTQFGYHLIKVAEKLPHREVYTAHIMVKLSKGMSKEDSAKAYEKIKEIYDRLKKGEEFKELCRLYSDDTGTKNRGGELPVVTYSVNFPREFINQAMSLSKDGDITEPFTTRFGWHIVKRISSKELPPFNDMKIELKNRVAKDMRSNMSRQALISKIKTWYKFKDYPQHLAEMTKVMDSSIFAAKWSAEKAAKMSKPLFTLDGKNFPQLEFAAWLESHQTPRAGMDFRQFLNSQYKAWLEETLVQYEENKLDEKYPKFKALMDEYRDGILLFDLTDKKVWSKGVKDTAGLREFYEKNKQKYLWDERAEVTQYTCADEKTAETVKKMIKKGKNDQEILNKLNKNNKSVVTLDRKVLLKGENPMVDANWTPGLSPNKKDGSKVVFLNVSKILAPSPKSLNECKGLVTADYQAHLEKEWLEELKAKYKVEINQEVLKALK